MMDLVKNITPGDLSAILHLNNQHAVETSELDEQILALMLERSFLALQCGDGHDGFLITFDASAAYESRNFHWFCERYEAFAYVDRIVVARHARGRGLARKFYDLLFKQARENGLRHVMCEVNIDPPNPVSDAFHARMGFVEVGRAVFEDSAKTVRYMMKDLTNDADC